MAYTDGLPQIVLIALPVPSFLLLVILNLYQLTPLLTLLPNIHLIPLLQRLSTIIPHPKRHRNLPRKAFNLPPRPESIAEDVRVLGIRGKVILLLALHSTIALVTGWAYLVRGGWWLASLSITPIPSVLATLAMFSVYTGSRWRRVFGKSGGITHQTIFTRILPLSFVSPGLLCLICAVVPEQACTIILAFNSILTIAVLGLSAIGGWRSYMAPKKGPIRLAGSQELGGCGSEESLPGTVTNSWLTSPSRVESGNISSFNYSTYLQTPHANRSRPRTSTDNGTPTSWLSSPTNTPSTLPSWDLSVSTPPEAHLPRSRSPSPGPMTTQYTRSDGLPAPPRRDEQTAAKMSRSTIGNQTMTTITSPGGSIIAGYEPDPFYPLPPRGFQSLTSFPLSPDQDQAGESRVSLDRVNGDGVGYTFVPGKSKGSTWTLESWHTASAETQTPDTNERRAPPPPPIPPNMPLPPTPTAARSETAVEWDMGGKESTEFLMRAGEMEWVEVDGDVDGMDGWDRESRGVGVVTTVVVVLCYGLTLPLLINGLDNLSQILYLVSLLLPAPFLLLASYLLRYRPRMTTSQRRKSASTKSLSTTRSLALLTPSEISLPITLSPKLTPNNAKRSTFPSTRLSHYLQAKPSISNFGHNRPTPRPHTIYGLSDALAQDRAAEQAKTQTLTKRSSDIWIANGHAKEGGGRWSRTTEMLKPVPAMRVLDSLPIRPASTGMLKRLRGGIVSMLPGQAPSDIQLVYMREHHRRKEYEVPQSPITINVESPSKHDQRRQSALSGYTEDVDAEGEGMTTMPTVEIQVATKGRMSSSPMFFYGRGESPKGEEGYDLDWMTAGVLPGLVPHIKIGADVRVGPGPSDRRVSHMTSEVPDTSMGTIPRFRGSLDMATPSRHGHPSRRGHSRGYSTSLDLGNSPDFHGLQQSTPYTGVRRRIKHKSSFSLPTIDTSTFEDVRSSFDECRGEDVEFDSAQGDEFQDQHADRVLDLGIDLPPIPEGITRDPHGNLSRVTERTEQDEANESSLMRQTMDEMGSAILALQPAPTSLKRKHPTPSPLNLATTSKQDTTMDFGCNCRTWDEFAVGVCDCHSNLGHSVLGTDEEGMVEEMERVMAMDTPTRTEYVISPPPESYASGRDSRASQRTTMTFSDADSIPLPIVTTSSTRYSTGWNTDTPDQFTDAEGETDLHVSDIPQLRQYPSQAFSAASSHPHPPPQAIRPVSSMPNFSRPRFNSSQIGQHPPVGVKEYQRELRSKRSSETIESNSTAYTTSTAATTTPSPVRETFKPSKKDLERITRLKERAEATKKGRGSGKGAADEALQVKKGLKPLQLVSKRNSNQIMPPPPLATEKRNSNFRVLGDSKGQDKTGDGGQDMDVRGGGKSSGKGKMSNGSGKENVRGGKPKLSSGSTGIQVLRA